MTARITNTHLTMSFSGQPG